MAALASSALVPSLLGSTMPRLRTRTIDLLCAANGGPMSIDASGRTAIGPSTRHARRKPASPAVRRRWRSKCSAQERQHSSTPDVVIGKTIRIVSHKIARGAIAARLLDAPLSCVVGVCRRRKTILIRRIVQGAERRRRNCRATVRCPQAVMGRTPSVVGECIRRQPCSHTIRFELPFATRSSPSSSRGASDGHARRREGRRAPGDDHRDRRRRRSMG